MEAISQSHRTLRFGVFDVDLRTAELRKHGVRIRLEEQPFHILALLLECPGELVTREELRQRLWSADTFVDFDRSLNKAMSKLRLALGDSAESPRYIETLHRRGYRFIAPIQHDEPASAHAAAHESDPGLRTAAVQAAASQVASNVVVSPVALRPAWWLHRWYWMAAVSVVVVGFGAIFYLRARPITLASSPATVVPRRSVAVLGFKNLSGRADQAWVSTALSDWLTTELAAGEELRTIPAESVARMRIELSLPDVDSLGKESLGRIGKNLGTDFVVVGSYASLRQESGGQVRLDLRLQDARSGETIDAVSETGTESRLFDLVSQAGEHLRKRLGAQGVTRQEAAEIAFVLPTNHDAARLYSEGLGKLRVFDALAARDLFEKAIFPEPQYALSHASLATAWATLGYDENARTEAKRAFELSANLPRAERLLVEGRYYETSKNWEKAIEIYRALVAFFPDSLDYGLALAQAQVSGGKGKEALETVETLQKLPPPLGDDPRIDLVEARAAESLGDYRRDQTSCARAAQKARALGASLLLAQARSDQAWALSNLGSSDEAVQAAAEAKQIFDAADDQRGVAKAINLSGIALENKGDSVGAKKMYEQALATFRRIGNKLGVANELDDLGDVLLALGDPNGARQKYEESLATNQEIANPDGIALVKGALGVVLLALGDHQVAKKSCEESVELSRRIGDREKAAIGLACLGSAYRAEGNFVPARRNESEAIAIFDEIGDRQSSSRFQLELAELSIDEHNGSEAAAIAKRVIEEFERENALRDESLAHAVLSRALLAQGRIEDAKQAIERSSALSEKYQDRPVELFTAITAARVRAASSNAADRAKAADRLQQVLAESARMGLLGYAFEARLALGEIEMSSGNRAAGRGRLESLQKDASQKGLGLIAQQAASAMQEVTAQP
jgi:DNA-binding winged helix-turn-helix (wHTH) protein/tetratricopeptide (TPR) repeat protein